MSLEREHYLEQLRAANVGLELAEAEATRRFGPPASAVVFDDRLEKAIEHEGDKMMQKAGFTVVRFSQARKTRQTPGIPDRRYYRRPREIETPTGRYYLPPLVVWWEAKSSSGKQRPGQKVFQELCEDCHEAYVLGGLDELAKWLRVVGLYPSTPGEP